MGSSRLLCAPPRRAHAQFRMLRVLRRSFEIQPIAPRLILLWSGYCSGPDLALATHRKLAETYLACVFGRQCHTGFAHRPSYLMTLTSLLSAHRGFRVALVQPFKQPASSDPGELIIECFLIDVSDPALCTGSQLVRPGIGRHPCCLG